MEIAQRFLRRRSLIGWLVAWYGVYQGGHVILNASYLLGDGPPPFPGPVAGWHDQAVAFLNAFAFFDLINAVAAVVFAVAWWLGRRWRVLGTVVLTVSMYAAAAFTYGVVAADAWRTDTMSAYLGVWVPFAPVVVLAIVWTFGDRGGAVDVRR